MERFKRASKDEDPDRYVLNVFLPLLVIAILACIGGCCYMERRRRRRKMKNGGVDPEEARHRTQDLNDAASVISSGSSKRRHYLNPTPTTGRTVRGAAVRSNYSAFGEPLYDTERRRRSSAASQNHLWNGNSNQDNSGWFDERPDRPSSRYSNGYGGRPLSRARSMTDIRQKDDSDRSLRRSRSTTSFGRLSSEFADSGYHDNQSNSETENTYEFLNIKHDNNIENPPPFENNRAPSPTQSSYSVRTAPSRTAQDEYHKQLPSRSALRSMSSQYFDAYRNRSLKRSVSQPDLSRLTDSKTYPQGILKKDNTGDVRSRRSTNHYGYSSGQGEPNDYNGYYAHRPASNAVQQTSENQSNTRASSRPSSAMSYRPQTSYEPYYNRQYGDYTGYGSYNHAPAYSTSGYHRHYQLPGKYSAGHDQYGTYNDYWSNYAHGHRMSMY